MLSEQLELCLRQDPRSCALRKPQLTGALTGDGAEGAVDQRACSGRGGGVAVLVKDRGSGDRRNSCNRLDLKKNPFDLSVQTSLLLPAICLLERMCLVFVCLEVLRTSLVVQWLRKTRLEVLRFVYTLILHISHCHKHTCGCTFGRATFH